MDVLNKTQTINNVIWSVIALIISCIVIKNLYVYEYTFMVGAQLELTLQQGIPTLLMLAIIVLCWSIPNKTINNYITKILFLIIGIILIAIGIYFSISFSNHMVSIHGNDWRICTFLLRFLPYLCYSTALFRLFNWVKINKGEEIE